MSNITLKEWLDAHFSEPYAYGYFLDIEPLPTTPTQHIQFMTEAFNNCEALLKPYNNGQLNQGLWFLASDAHDLSDNFGNPVDWDIRQACIQSFKSLNKNLFAKRCDPATSAYKSDADAPNNPLNMIYYMWWDIFTFWESLDPKSVNRVDAELFDVMAYCLSINHIAVLESALHGLSHIPNHRKHVKIAVETFLKTKPDLHENLKSYAKASIDGCNL